MQHFTLSLFRGAVRAAVWSCFPAAPVNSRSSTDSAQSVAARAETLLGSSLGGADRVSDSPHLHASVYGASGHPGDDGRESHSSHVPAEGGRGADR